MRNINHLLSGTPFDNGTFQFYATMKKDVHPSDFYTPTHIIGWEFFERFKQGRAKANILHELGHIIDLYMSGKHNRLLKNNFGWKLSDKNNKIPREWLMVEVNAVIIQYIISEGIVRKRRIPDNDSDLRRVYNEMSLTPFAKTKKQWESIWTPSIETLLPLGKDYFIDVWNDASDFIKANR